MRFSDAPSTRASFLNQLKDPNDARAWAAFTEMYKPVFDEWCRSQKLQDADAEDVCSCALAKVWNKMGEFRYDPARRFRGWLRTLVQNELRDFLRHRRRRPDSSGSGNADVQKALEQIEASPDIKLLGPDLDQLEAEQDLLQQAMQRVEARAEAKTWQAWLLTMQQDRPPKDVASLLGMKVASIYKAKQRINEMIREEYAAAAGRHGLCESE